MRIYHLMNTEAMNKNVFSVYRSYMGTIRKCGWLCRICTWRLFDKVEMETGSSDVVSSNSHTTAVTWLWCYFHPVAASSSLRDCISCDHPTWPSGNRCLSWRKNMIIIQEATNYTTYCFLNFWFPVQRKSNKEVGNYHQRSKIINSSMF